jgi:Domain of unknown function (DUF4920)
MHLLKTGIFHHFCNMRVSKLFCFLALTLGAVACANPGGYGEKITTAKTSDVREGLKLFQEKGIAENTLKGKISKVCQTEGCWFMFALDSGELFVDFDHKFEIPKDVAGRTATAQGHFYRDTTTVEQLKEYAKDDGKSAKEIEAITEPEIRTVFLATGVSIESEK